MVIPRSFVLYTIVAVGVLRVGVPLGFRADFTVFIGHHNVALTSGLAGELKGYIGEPPHVGFAALANLDKLQVASHYLVVGSIAVSELDNFAICSNLERPHGLVRVEVALPRLCFHHLVRAIRQGTGIGLSNTVHYLDGGTYLTGLV